jgi:phage-related protein
MGALLRLVQRGEKLSLPHSRPMTQAIGRRCHELRVRDAESGLTWRLVYRVDADAIIVAHWWAKKTERTTTADLALCRKRLALYDLDRAKGKR